MLLFKVIANNVYVRVLAITCVMKFPKKYKILMKAFFVFDFILKVSKRSPKEILNARLNLSHVFIW